MSGGNFLILGNQRTGTTFLCYLLEQRGDLAYLGELWPSPGEIAGNFVEALFRGRGDSFAKLHHCLTVSPHPEVEFLARWDVLEYLAREGIPVIHVRRRNLLDVALSLALAERDGVWGGGPYLGPISIPAERLGRSMALLGDSDRWVAACLVHLGIRHLEVWYDRVVGEVQATHDGVADFLGRPRMEVPPNARCIRQRRGGQSENLANYAELKSEFLGTPLGVYFED